jgi:hypothetical protein
MWTEVHHMKDAGSFQTMRLRDGIFVFVSVGLATVKVFVTPNLRDAARYVEVKEFTLPNAHSRLRLPHRSRHAEDLLLLDRVRRAISWPNSADELATSLCTMGSRLPLDTSEEQPKMSSIAHEAIQTAREKLGLQGREAPPRPGSALDRTLEVTAQLIVNFCRELGAYNNCPPTAKTSDQKILEIYSLINTAFQEAARRRGEQIPIPAELINRIVSGFLQMYEKMGESFMREHLRYEIDKYMREGLRPDYKRPLPFFSDSASSPRNRP